MIQLKRSTAPGFTQSEFFLRESFTLTHTHMHVLWRLFINIIIFILFKLYILSPKHTPKSYHHKILSAFLHFQTSFSIYKLFSWGLKYSHKVKNVITGIFIFAGTFGPHTVGFSGTNTCIHTHTFFLHKSIVGEEDILKNIHMKAFYRKKTCNTSPSSPSLVQLNCFALFKKSYKNVL